MIKLAYVFLTQAGRRALRHFRYEIVSHDHLVVLNFHLDDKWIFAAYGVVFGGILDKQLDGTRKHIS